MINEIKKYCKSWYCCDSNTEFNQIIIAFTYGLIFGSLSKGLLWFIVFIIIYECFLFYVTDGLKDHWTIRLVVNLSLLVGWIFGRYLILNKFNIY
jgi:hypothetical protein